MEKNNKHTPENCWYDNKLKEYVPLEKLTDEHLINARMWAQKKEGMLMKAAWEFTDKIEILDAEAARRGITPPDYRSKFQKNKKVLVKARTKIAAEKAQPVESTHEE